MNVVAITRTIMVGSLVMFGGALLVCGIVFGLVGLRQIKKYGQQKITSKGDLASLLKLIIVLIVGGIIGTFIGIVGIINVLAF